MLSSRVCPSTMTSLESLNASTFQFVLGALHGIRTCCRTGQLKLSQLKYSTSYPQVVVVSSVCMDTYRPGHAGLQGYLIEPVGPTFMFCLLASDARQLAASFPHHRPFFPNPTPSKPLLSISRSLSIDKPSPHPSPVKMPTRFSKTRKVSSAKPNIIAI